MYLSTTFGIPVFVYDVSSHYGLDSPAYGLHLKAL